MHLRLTLIIFCLLSYSIGQAQDQTLLTKKEAKIVNGMFPAEWLAEALDFPDMNTSLTGLLKEGDRIYLLKQQEQILGYLLLTRAMGRFDYFDYLLVYDPDLSVRGISITAYRSAHGGAICQKRWLSQFEAYAGQDLTLGKEIDAVSGATISASAMVEDVKRCYELMINLREEGLVK